MKLIYLVTLLAMMIVGARAEAATQCSIEALEKLIVEVPAGVPPAPPGEVFNPNPAPSPDPYHDQLVLWGGDFDTPTSIVVRLGNRTGEVVFRVAFLDRHNYVMTETVFDYPDHKSVLAEQNREVTASPGRSTHYFFCGDEVQLRPGMSAFDIEKRTAISNNQRAWFFDEPVKLFDLDLSRIPN